MAFFTIISLIPIILTLGISQIFARDPLTIPLNPISMPPNEVIVNSICPYFSLKELLTFGAVSKKFYALTSARMSTFEKLKIHQKSLTTVALVSIAKRFTKLNTLKLTQCKLESCHTEIIKKMTTLTFLDLSCNNIDNAGGDHLANLTNLTYLKLFDNQIGNEGIKKLATHPSLTELDVGSNQIKDEGIKYLIKHCKANLTILNNPFSLELKWELEEKTDLRLNL